MFGGYDNITGFTPNNDVHNTSPTPAPAIMLSSVTVVDNDGNAVHQTQSSGLRNHSNPTTVSNHANVMNTSSSTRDMSPSTICSHLIRSQIYFDHLLHYENNEFRPSYVMLYFIILLDFNHDLFSSTFRCSISS